MTSTWRTEHELVARRTSFVERLQARQLDGALVLGDSGRGWLTGYNAASHDTVPTAAVLVGPDRATLYTSANNRDWAASLAPGVEVATWKRPWWPDLAAHIAATGWQRIGFEPDHLSVAGYEAIRAELPSGVTLTDIGDDLVALRAVKSPAELDALRRASEITDRAFTAATTDLQPGITEGELAWRLERAMRDLGAEEPGFPIIVAAGRHAARPHHAPTEYPIAEGEPIIIDMGARFDGYTADLTRTIWIGDPDQRIRQLYPLVDRANEAAIAAIRAGVAGRAVDSAARDVIAAAGYGDAFIHGLGHGTGLEIHEAPSCGQRSDDFLVSGNIVTVEPGIYLPDWGGIRIEDLGVVTNDGFEVFSVAPRASLD
ncbi:MAG TPA: aminopeptidase P family protein [Thermomicrobiales bacterium]|jgi:Xaa-Pro aminopeptidase|nr:aminopeptidase P family protein [Thermomicrobiales bacterium]